MTTVSTGVIRSMYNHLVQTYSDEEARDILVQKYPEQEGEILELRSEVVSEDVGTEDEVELAQAVQAKVTKTKASKPAKVAKPKAVKAPKPVKAKSPSKMDRARELYTSATDKSRSAMIAVFGKELGLSKAAASTYYYSVKK